VGSVRWVEETAGLTGGGAGSALAAVGAGADGTLDVSAAVTDFIGAVAIDAPAKIVMLMCPN